MGGIMMCLGSAHSEICLEISGISGFVNKYTVKKRLHYGSWRFFMGEGFMRNLGRAQPGGILS